jgi:radical SAM superfamily enzyme YgiQ (UPF0313 family)
MPEKSESPLPDSPLRRLRVCLINPRFNPNYFGMDHVLPLLPGDKRNIMVTGALPALAALTPDHCSVELVDENVEPIDFEALKDYDVIGVTGMIVQHQRMREILLRIKDYPATVVLGGPYVSVAESQFIGLCDVRFIGESELTWPQFLRALARDEPILERYEQPDRTDMSTVPPPRYDLLKAPRYVMATLQFSRGCPFMCEFCDIITIFGRKPRTKSPAQMIREFDAIRAAGFTRCFLVDDNFIGNKHKAKELLAALIQWQEANHYPLIFTTEASINLADDAEMMQLMVKANFRQVFIGIESPRAASLEETRKVQNTRGDGLLEKIQRVRDAGLVINGGFMVGFDNDDEAVFEEQYDFISAAGIANASLAILTPIPSTPLYKRLETEGRLDFGRTDVIFHPKKMTRDVLKNGYVSLMKRLYDPAAYFNRLLGGYEKSPQFRDSRRTQDRRIGAKVTVAGRLLEWIGGCLVLWRLLRVLSRNGALASPGRAYWHYWRRNRQVLGADAIPFATFVRLCAEHWHFFNIANDDQTRFGSVVAA